MQNALRIGNINLKKKRKKKVSKMTKDIPTQCDTFL